MKHSKKIICVLASLCVVLVIMVCVLLVKILMPQVSGAQEQQMSQTPAVQSSGDMAFNQEQEQHSSNQSFATQAPDADVQNPEEPQDIGREAAKTAALTHVGLSESQVTDMKVEQDWDDGRLEYEVEFKFGGMEYEYTIDGASGIVLSCEKEIDD